MHDKILRLIENTGWMTISNFGSKILIFLLVPFYTRVLSTEDYGYYDLVYTAIVLCSPFITASIAEAVMRFTLIDESDASVAFSGGLFVSCFGIIVAVLSGLIVWFSIPIDDLYKVFYEFAVLMFSTDALYALLSRFTRSLNEMKCMAFGSLLQAASLLIFSVLLLIPLKLGVCGYFLATALANASAALYMFTKIRAWRYIKHVNMAYTFEMIRYGMPLGVNTAGWWTTNVLGRYAVAFFIGVSGTGLLAAAYKIPSIPKVIQQVFIQAWQISAIQEFGDEDSPEFFSKIYNTMCLASSVLTSGIICIIPLIALLMFSESFYDAWKLVPLLMVGVVFDCLASIVGGVFSAAGNSKPLASSALVSVVVAALVCLVFVPTIGTYGAVISSALASFAIWAMRLLQSRKYMTFAIKWRQNLCCFAVLLAQIGLASYIEISWFWFVPQIILFVILFLMFARAINLGDLTKRVAAKIRNKDKD